MARRREQRLELIGFAQLMLSVVRFWRSKVSRILFLSARPEHHTVGAQNVHHSRAGQGVAYARRDFCRSRNRHRYRGTRAARADRRGAHRARGCAYGRALRCREDRSSAGNRAGKFCRRAAAGDRAVKDPAELTLTEVAGALRRRTFSSTELTRWMLERIGRWQPAINAFVRVEEDEALAAAKRADRALARGKAKGALCGVPLAHKDMYYIKGKLSECGSKVRKGWIAPATSTALTRSPPPDP